jgi:manganese/zinc/iron transport system permease protein
VLSALAGAVWSQNAEQTPTGPAVVLVASALLAVSLLVAPQRGLWWSWLRLQAHRRKVRHENLLTDFFRLGERGEDWRSWTAPELAAVRRQEPRQVRRTLQELEGMGLVTATGGATPGESRWHLTFVGHKEAARVVRNHRLWELYLARRLDLALDHVHRDAEDMEHTLPPEVLAELEATFHHPKRDPHGHPIPPAPAQS